MKRLAHQIDDLARTLDDVWNHGNMDSPDDIYIP